MKFFILILFLLLNNIVFVESLVVVLVKPNYSPSCSRSMQNSFLMIFVSLACATNWIEIRVALRTHATPPPLTT